MHHFNKGVVTITIDINALSHYYFLETVAELHRETRLHCIAKRRRNNLRIIVNRDKDNQKSFLVVVVVVVERGLWRSNREMYD